MENSNKNKDHETHYCCDARLKEKGGQTTCCACDFHDGCEIGNIKLNIVSPLIPKNECCCEIDGKKVCCSDCSCRLPKSEEKKCDGCLRNLPIQNGYHFSLDGHIDTYCSKERYVPKSEEAQPEYLGYEDVKTGKFHPKSEEKCEHKEDDLNCEHFPSEVKPSNWEIEFDKLCTGKSGNMTWAIENTHLKDFIRSTLSHSKTLILEEVEKFRNNIGKFPYEGVAFTHKYVDKKLEDLLKVIKEGK